MYYKTERWRITWTSLLAVILLAVTVSASLGDRLPEFKECVQTCKEANCGANPTPIPLQRRLLLWNCASECDYHCQHIVTDTRLARDPNYREPLLQFHGKWPFYRYMGMQEPFSVLFSLFNYLAHANGLSKIRESIPQSYPLRKYYVIFAYLGLTSWVFSMIFHTRDYPLTEKLDYFSAGGSVMYGMYYTPVRIFRMDNPSDPENRRAASLLRLWTGLCITLYILHVTYLSLWSWDYTYNMAANVIVGVTQNLLWSGYSIRRYRRSGRFWAAWPGLIVAWIILAMSLEVFDFAPWGGMIDAHSLWHLGTVAPTVWWYNFLVKDAQDDLQGMRLKAEK
ncbi:Mn2+ homeostasis protein-like protein Per1 [Venturia nashicola]|nr:Mn2+ homeostasis protein-like protein Per1 [Venturia nashicola]